MPSPLPPGVTAAVLRMTVDTITEGQHCQNTFDYLASAPGSPTPFDMADFQTQWALVMQANYLACLSPKTEIFSKILAEIHYGTTPSNVVLVTPGSLPGTAGATNLPLEVAATINRIGSIKGKHGRGRVQMPAIPDTFVTPAVAGSVLNATALTAYNAFKLSMLTSIVCTSFNWAPIISVRPTPPSNLVGFATLVSACSVNTILGTVRRRKIGRGI